LFLFFNVLFGLINGWDSTCSYVLQKKVLCFFFGIIMMVIWLPHLAMECGRMLLSSVNTAQYSVAQRQPSLNVFFQALSYPTASSATVQVCFGSHPIVHHPGQLAGLQRSLKV